MADQDRVLQVQRVDHRGQVVGVGIHVVAVPGLAGAAVAAAVVRNHAIAALPHEQHLRVPGIGGQRPAVGEHDRLSAAPLLIAGSLAEGREGTGRPAGASGSTAQWLSDALHACAGLPGL
ncbi:hypothetical protein G6F24_014745 [Rhizopus arrhizus]|nr:hypothetical protein G6F24_014745 [Rhizopus arrhizus]